MKSSRHPLYLLLILLLASKVIGKTKEVERLKPENVPYSLFKRLALTPKNLNFSPLSLKLVFSLIYPGASGKPESILQQLFGFKAGQTTTAESEYKLTAGLANQKENSPQITISNSAWFKDEKSVSLNFKNSLKAQQASAHPLNLKKMNHWVDQETHGKIPKLMDALDPSAVAIFINAIYFKAAWVSAFKKNDTHLAPFFATPKNTVKVQTMHRLGQILYYEDEESKWVELPYRNSEFVLRLALPKQKFNLKAIEDGLSSESLAQIEKNSSLSQVALALPRFKFSNHLSLKEFLTQSGYPELFSAKASDFEKISKTQNMQISDVIQASAIEVNEEGTEAAAATGATMVGLSLKLSKREEFNANEPFLFILQNKHSGEIYFMGQVLDPNQ